MQLTNSTLVERNESRLQEEEEKFTVFRKTCSSIRDFFSWALVQEIPFVRESLLIEEEACVDNLHY